MKNKKIFVLFPLILMSLPILAFAEGTVILENPLKFNEIKALLENIANIFSGVIGAISTVMFLVAGMLFLSSSGNAEKLGTAKKALIYAIIGAIVAITANVIIKTVYWVIGK